MIIGETEQQREEREVDRSARLRKSFKSGVFTDEFGVENPHIGPARCIHGELVSNCEKCAKK